MSPATSTAVLPSELAPLRERFSPLFERIAAGTVERERERRLPAAEIAELDEAGFGTLRVPREHGGPGVSIETFTHLLVDLARADSNIAHQYRSHFGFLESLRFQPAQVQDLWYPRILAGATVGNASTERGGNRLGTLNTQLASTSDGTTVSGTKYYTTGTIFADYTRVSAALEGQDGRCFAVVPTDAPGVTIEDDWDGFGQKLTGTGTTVLESVAVEPGGVLEREPGGYEATHEAAFFQHVLLVVLAGIARAARDDAAFLVASRSRTFNTGSGLPFREDPLIQEAVGRLAAKAFSAEAVVLQCARALDEGLVASEDPADGADGPRGVDRAEIALEQAQISVPELALGAAQDLFLTVGASATSTSKALDRHWRNAQTVATHNPIAFRARSVGDHFINGTVPEGLNAIGEATSATAGTPSKERS
ncbi:acyl-CoA dehydrogenase [Brachybacterium ginsengisoli]|uniref:Dibenzothiophene monooxygenase n=1 Tax=Brachybacterium ginsengisoli TaxID=1331682 RepID=A0A291GX58_9MICO|nr:acyl-CoA dehydrogenase family protein [Brachybacterium ginsengisoli]ATG54758.1 acyl-CoA dehydrogenase [Brachybacterium ginsengisoli]